MKYLRQFLIILMISFLGEVCHAVLPLPIPASIYGLVLMLVGLISGIVPLAAVRDAAKFLVGIMPVMFIPAAVGLMVSWPILRPVCIPILVIVFVSTVLVMGFSGRVTQMVIRMQKKDSSGKTKEVEE